VYEAETWAVPAAVAVKLAVQVAVPAVPPADKLQGLVEPKEPLAEPVPWNDTVPRGVVGEESVSVTVVVHVEAWLTMTGVLHETLVVVACDAAPTVTEWDTTVLSTAKLSWTLRLTV